jgi:hypothetical protein
MNAELRARLLSFVSRKMLIWYVATGAAIAGKVDWIWWGVLTAAIAGVNEYNKRQKAKQNGEET